MASREHWVENHRCPQCDKTGTAELSQMDDSFDIRVDSVLEGFRVVEDKLLLVRCPGGPLMMPSRTVIMRIAEPRPRGTVLGERADRRRVGEAEHFFKCKASGGYFDARDLTWTEDHEGPLPHPAQDGIQ